MVADDQTLFEKSVRCVKVEYHTENEGTPDVQNEYAEYPGDSDATHISVGPPPAKKTRKRRKKPTTVNDIIVEEIVEATQESAPQETTTTEPVYVMSQPSSTQSFTVAPLMSSDELLQSYVNIVLCDGLPITFMSGFASTHLFNTINQCAGLRENVDPGRLEEMIMERAQNEKYLIGQELQNRTGLSLILESNTVCKESCAILVQFHKDNSIQRRLLGVLMIGDCCDEEKETLMLEYCESFGVPRSSIYTIQNKKLTVSLEDEEGGQLTLPIYIPCVATLFSRAIKQSMNPWRKTLAKIQCSNRSPHFSITDLLRDLQECAPNATDLDAKEVETVTAIIDWLDKARAVHEKITDPNSCKLVTDAVAAVYKFWIQTDRQSGVVPKEMATSLKTDFCNVLCNYKAIQGAMFLDPRIQQLLSATDKTAAIGYLHALYNKLFGGPVEEVPEEDIEEEMDNEDNDEDEDDLTAFLKKKTKSEGSKMHGTKIERLLTEFSHIPLLSSKADLLSYWSKSDQDDCLKRLAVVVHSVAGVQQAFVDPSYIRQVRSNDWIHSEQLQEAIFLVGGGLRLNGTGTSV